MDKQRASEQVQHKAGISMDMDEYIEVDDELRTELARKADEMGQPIEAAAVLKIIDKYKQRGLLLAAYGRKLRNAAHMAGVRIRRADREGEMFDAEALDAWMARVDALIVPFTEIEANADQLIGELEGLCPETEEQSD